MVQRKSFNLNLARTARRLSGARRVAMLLAVMLLTMTAQTAWAQAHIEFHLVDQNSSNNFDWNWTVTINSRQYEKAELVSCPVSNGPNSISVSLPEGAYVERIEITYFNSNDEPINDPRDNPGNIIEFFVDGISSENSTVNVSCHVRYPRYTVKFFANGGSGSMDDQTFVVDVSQNLTNCSFNRENYTFAGWAESENGYAVYTDGKSVMNLANEGETKNLYATWSSGEGVTYTVTFDMQGGSGGTSSVNATYNEPMPPIDVPMLTHYAFDGYFTQTNGQGTKYYNADGSSAKTFDLTEATTLYAKWVDKTYTVTLSANGGSGGTESVTVKYGDAMPAITLPSRTGYSFRGYYGDNGNGNAYYNSDGSSARTYDLTTNTTLYAMWTKSTPIEMTVTAEDVNITYDGQGHQITVNVSDPASGATITYCETEDGTYTSTNPSYTNAGVNTVYYKVTASGYTDYSGSATVTINPP